jgi:hypothetical protein
VNSGLPVWHVSLCYWKSTPVATSRWGDGMRRAALRLADEILRGVGRGESVKHYGEMVLHVRRSLTDEEVNRLSLRWLAIPARDGFAPDQGIETKL